MNSDWAVSYPLFPLTISTGEMGFVGLLSFSGQWSVISICTLI